MGQTLKQGHALLVGLGLLHRGFTPLGADLVLARQRQLVHPRHARRARALALRRDVGREIILLHRRGGLGRLRLHEEGRLGRCLADGHVVNGDRTLANRRGGRRRGSERVLASRRGIQPAGDAVLDADEVLGRDGRHRAADLRRPARLHGLAASVGALVAALQLGEAVLGDHLLGDHRRIDPGRHHRHADDAVQLLVEGGAEDDVGVRVHFLTDAGRRLVHLEQGHVLAAGDGDEQAAGAAHGGLVQQRVGDGGFGGLEGALVAGGFAGAHHRLAHVAHHGAHVGEVEVDEAFLHHQVGDAGDAGIEHLVRHGEGVGEGGVLVGHPEQVLVRDDDQRVDALLKLVDAVLGHPHAAGALEVEGLGHHAHGEDAKLAGRAGHHRGSARASAAAHAGGDEHHVRAGQVIADLVDHLFGGGAADFRLGAGAEALGHRHAHLHHAVRLGERERLGIRVGHHELHAVKARHDHVVDGVATGATHTEHRDSRTKLTNVGHLKIDRHAVAPSNPT